jgi:hypothetical protein
MATISPLPVTGPPATPRDRTALAAARVIERLHLDPADLDWLPVMFPPYFVSALQAAMPAVGAAAVQEACPPCRI